VEPVSEEVISAATELRAVSRNGVGVDNFPLLQLQERGIRVHTADGANAAGVAELTIGLMFSALRHIPLTDAGIKAGGWPAYAAGKSADERSASSDAATSENASLSS
jgi:D-3-phosphoglycerate dehydrogenase